jgi:tetratricopeptide (TPR) repeat protein
MLAYHYSRSENLDKAYQYLKLSGEKSMRNFATREAFSFYHEAFDLLKKQEETQENQKNRLEILVLLTAPMRLLAYPEGSLNLLQEGERLSQEMGEERSLATFYSRMGHYYTAREGNPLLGIEYGERCWEGAEKIRDLELMAIAGLDLCTAYLASGKPLEIVNLAPKVLALLEDAGKEHGVFGAGLNVYAGTLGYYLRSLGQLGDFDAARANFEKGLSFALAMDDKASLGFMEAHYGWHLMEKGDGKKAAEHFQKAIRSLDEVKYVGVLGLAWTGLGEAYRQMGELKTAKRYIEKGLNAHKDVGLAYFLCFHYRTLGMLHFDLGDLDGAKDFLEQALRLSEKHHQGDYELSSRMWLGRTLARKDPSQAEEAERQIQQGIQMAEESKLRLYVADGYHFLGELYAARGERETSLENLKRAASMYQEMGVDYWLTQAQATLARLEADRQ